jgi:DNA polymerase I-like protein with 3'-5' exonuclease and polymerase domains
MGFEVITSIREIGNFIKVLSSNPEAEIALDTETSSLDTATCRIYVLSLVINDNAFVFDLTKFDKLTYVIQLIEKHKIVGHNLKYDIKVIKNNTGVLLTNCYDTMLAEILIHQGTGKQLYSLEETTFNYLGKQLNKDVRESFYANGEVTSLTQEQIIYSIEDVLNLFEIKAIQIAKLTEQKQINVLDLENKVLPVVASMEINGILLNREKWTALMHEAEEKAKELKKQILENVIGRLPTDCDLLTLADMVRVPVKTKKARAELENIKELSFVKDWLYNNINTASHTQMLAIFNMVGIAVESTGEKVLREYSHKNNDPILALVLEYREYEKKASSFGESILNKISPVTGRLHTTFNQLRAASGRFSSDSPNLQQVPRESEYRNCFIAKPGCKLITADYSQQELRIAGSATKEPKFIKTFAEHGDMHALTASLVFDVPLDQVTKAQRTTAKSINFAVLYGSTEYGLSYNFDLELDYARELLVKYFTSYPVLRDFKSKAEDMIVKRKFSSTLLGRKRFFEERIWFKDSREMEKYQNQMKREGFNHIVQGSGADIVKQALCYIFFNNPFGELLKILMTIHDEIVCEATDEIAEKAKDFIVKCMLDAEQPFLGEIEAAVDAKIDTVWSK